MGTSRATGSSQAIVKRCRAGSSLDLKRHDPSETFGWQKQAAIAELPTVMAEVAGLQDRLFAERSRSLLVVLQAIDAGGKDGTIRTVFRSLNPAGVAVTAFAAPSSGELAHDYLWRLHAHTPHRGTIGVFNRSHYEDVLVVRVKELVPERVWRRRYRHIREFERMLGDEGTTVIKLFLNISKDEQRERLQDRIDDPTERWKFRAADLAERELWDDYQLAFGEALRETSTTDAPWYVVPGNRKWVRNLVVAKLLEHHLRTLDPQYPPAEPGVEQLIVP
jgi:PPK2 family polyphosphate:nucleotide phosphotransferase